MTERTSNVRVLFKAPHVRAWPRPDRPTVPDRYPTDRYPTGQLPEAITARLNNAEHDFLTTEKLRLTTLRNSYHLSPIRNHRPRARTTVPPLRRPTRSPNHHWSQTMNTTEVVTLIIATALTVIICVAAIAGRRK